MPISLSANSFRRRGFGSRLGPMLQTFGHLGEGRSIGCASNFFKEVIRKRSPFGSSTGFQLSMELIRNVSELDHLGHVVELTYMRSTCQYRRGSLSHVAPVSPGVLAVSSRIFMNNVLEKEDHREICIDPRVNPSEQGKIVDCMPFNVSRVLLPTESIVIQFESVLIHRHSLYRATALRS